MCIFFLSVLPSSTVPVYSPRPLWLSPQLGSGSLYLMTLERCQITSALFERSGRELHESFQSLFTHLPLRRPRFYFTVMLTAFTEPQLPHVAGTLHNMLQYMLLSDWTAGSLYFSTRQVNIVGRAALIKGCGPPKSLWASWRFSQSLPKSEHLL